MRTGPEGAGHRHCRVHAEFAGLVGGRRNDAALGSPDGDRFPRKFRAIEQLDRHEEGVHVDVEHADVRIVVAPESTGFFRPRRSGHPSSFLTRQAYAQAPSLF